jgi:hypothetical protein
LEVRRSSSVLSKKLSVSSLAYDAFAGTGLGLGLGLASVVVVVVVAVIVTLSGILTDVIEVVIFAVVVLSGAAVAFPGGGGVWDTGVGVRGSITDGAAAGGVDPLAAVNAGVRFFTLSSSELNPNPSESVSLPPCCLLL